MATVAADNNRKVPSAADAVLVYAGAKILEPLNVAG
jgi:hypothetical protein